MFRHVALDHERGFLGIKPHRQPVRRNLDHRTLDQPDVVQVVSHRLVIGNQEKALVLVLHLDPVLQRAQVMPQVQLPRGPHAGENALLLSHCGDLRNVFVGPGVLRQVQC